MKNKPRVVIDTNALLVSISSKSKYHWLFQKLIQSKFDVFITNEILLEYEEIISNKFNQKVARNVIRTLLLLPNVSLVKVYYIWNLIQKDPDDNKFVDCAVSSNVNFIITNDTDFDILRSIDFPKVQTISIQDFKNLLK
jgi:putative PIN family toxin of toxin-antitoxin system